MKVFSILEKRFWVHIPSPFLFYKEKVIAHTQPEQTCPLARQSLCGPLLLLSLQRAGVEVTVQELVAVFNVS